MRIQPSQVHFSSSIALVTRPDFERISSTLIAPHEEEMRGDREMGYSDPFSLNLRAIAQPKAVVEGAKDCTIGGITNGQAVTLTHLFPDEQAGMVVGRTLAYDITELKKTANRELRGLIAAGRDYASATTAGSRENYNALLETMKDNGFGENVTRLWGRKSQHVSGNTDALYNSANDTWYLHVGRVPKIESPLAKLWDLPPLMPGFVRRMAKSLTESVDPTATKQDNPALSLEALKETFKDVYIAPGDTLVTPADGGYHALLADFLA